MTVALDLIDDIEATRRVRDELDETNVHALIGVLDDTPPIEVVPLDGGRYGVLAGYHRREAARRRGDVEVRVRVLSVPPDRWHEHALLSNAAHGKPLTLAERKRNAERLVAERPELSNRRVAQLAGLNHETVSAMRPETVASSDCSGGGNRHLNTREGADGKSYPSNRADASARRERTAEVVKAKPDATVREIAAESGVALATAADVKKRVTEGRPVDPRNLRTLGIETRQLNRMVDGRRLNRRGIEREQLATVAAVPATRSSTP